MARSTRYLERPTPPECPRIVAWASSPWAPPTILSHSTGVPLHDLTAALQLAATATPQWIDVGMLNGKPFINLVSGGFGSRVTVKVTRSLSGDWVDWPTCSRVSLALQSFRRAAVASAQKASHGKGPSWPLRSAMAGRLGAACRFALTR